MPRHSATSIRKSKGNFDKRGELRKSCNCMAHECPKVERRGWGGAERAQKVLEAKLLTLGHWSTAEGKKMGNRVKKHLVWTWHEERANQWDEVFPSSLTSSSYKLNALMMGFASKHFQTFLGHSNLCPSLGRLLYGKESQQELNEKSQRDKVTRGWELLKVGRNSRHPYSNPDALGMCASRGTSHTVTSNSSY